MNLGIGILFKVSCCCRSRSSFSIFIKDLHTIYFRHTILLWSQRTQRFRKRTRAHNAKSRVLIENLVPASPEQFFLADSVFSPSRQKLVHSVRMIPARTIEDLRMRQ